MKPKAVITQQTITLQSGTILVAKPFWGNSVYQKSVILIAEYTEEGCSGFILNKESLLNVNEALTEYNIDNNLHYGGPLENNSVNFIHNNPLVPDAIKIKKGIYIGGNNSFVESAIEDEFMSKKDIKFFAGAVYWTRTELLNEIMNDKWWIMDISAREFFSYDASDFYEKKLLDAGHPYGLMSNLPDPSMN